MNVCVSLPKKWQNSVPWQCWAGRGKRLEGEGKDCEERNRCHLSTSLPAVGPAFLRDITFWSPLPAFSCPFYFLYIFFLYIYCPQISWLIEASLSWRDASIFPLSILLPPCKWDNFPDFFPKTELRRLSLLLVTENIASQMLRELFCLVNEKISS